MKNRMFTRIVIGLAAMGAIACGSADDGERSTGGTVVAELQVLDFITTTPFPPLPGVEVCVYRGDVCATTDANGRVRLEMPANAETGVTFEKEGYVPGLTPYVTGDTDFSAQAMATADSLIETLAGILDTAWPLEGDGVVSLGTIGADPFVLGEDGIAGVTFSGIDAGRQFYFDGAIPSTAVDATTETLGSGGYIEMPPGDYEIVLGGAARNCRPYGAWEGDESNAFAFPIVAGYITYVFVMCVPAP